MWSLVTQQLQNARALAKLDESSPNEAALRRAVSTAYYAVFQALCETSAATLVGWDQSWESFTPIFRALEHKHAAQTLIREPFNSVDLKQLGEAFTDLQNARQWADYNPEPRPNYEPVQNASPFTRSEAVTLIESADNAVQILDRLDDEMRLKLATRLVTKSRK